MNYTQARQVYEMDVAIQSLDIVLGLVGGFTGLLWSALAILLGGYETFKLENSLIGAVYPTSPQKDEYDDQTEQSAKIDMMTIVAERGKYFYNYSEYLLSLILRFFCCCCASNKDGCLKRRMAKLERHEAASERLANEIDIVKLLYLQRISTFLSKLMLKKHQRALVTNFKSFQLSNLKAKKNSVQDEERLIPAIQSDGTVDILAHFKDENGQTNLTDD